MKWLWLFLLLTSPLTALSMRERQALEAFDLASLKVEAVYFKNEIGRPYALVRDTNGYLHRAFLGDYLGRNSGRITQISKQRMELCELHEGSQGEWFKHCFSIPVAPSR